MANRKYVVQVEEPDFNPFGIPKLKLDFKAAVYGRQSTKEQVEKNHNAYLQQAVKLVDMGKEFGFTNPDDIIVFIENKSKNGKWINASGRLRIDQRPGLSSLIELIEADVVKTVFVWAIDRLFRDEDMIQPPIFVKKCKDHQCVVLTVDDFFDFNNAKRDDRRRFLELAQAAADYITKHVRKMRDALNDTAMRGEYDGRGIPVGYYLPRGAKVYSVFSPFAPVIRWLFKRFRQLDGKLTPLCYEISEMEFLFPLPPEGIEAPYMRITRVKNGYTVSRVGLIGILTNIAYLGWWYYQPQGKKTLIQKDHHDAIIDGESIDSEGDVVTEEDFWYAFNVLSDTHIDGTPIELEDKPKQPPTHKTKVAPYQSLLEDVITSVDHPVYVIQHATSNRPAEYTIMNQMNWLALSKETDSSTYLAAIAVKAVDPAFVELIKFRLRYFQAIDTLLDKLGQEQREKSMFQQLKEVQKAVVKTNKSIDEQISSIKRKIGKLEKLLDVANKAQEAGEEDLDENTILDSLRQLGRLRKSLADLSSKKAEALATEEDLEDIAKRMTDASQGWDSLTYERQKKLVQLVVKQAVLTPINGRWFQLDIEWMDFMGFNFIDRGYIFNLWGRAGAWSDEDRAKLRELYPIADRDTILKAFPTRNWSSIRNQTSKYMKDISRSKTFMNNSLLPIWMSYEDKQIIDTYHINLGSSHYRHGPEKNFCWSVLESPENEASASRSSRGRMRLILHCYAKLSMRLRFFISAATLATMIATLAWASWARAR